MTSLNSNATANSRTNDADDAGRPDDDTARPMSNVAAATEDKLDDMLADSFPASDPPSFTPITGESKPRAEPAGGPTEPIHHAIRWEMVALAGAGFVIQAAATIWLFARLKGHFAAHPAAPSAGPATPPQ